MNWTEQLKFLELHSELLILENKDMSGLLNMQEAMDLDKYLHLDSATGREEDRGWMIFLFLKAIFRQMDGEFASYEAIIDKYTRKSAEVAKIQNGLKRLEILGYIRVNADDKLIIINKTIAEKVLNKDELPVPDELHLRIERAQNMMKDLFSHWLTPEERDLQRITLIEFGNYISERTIVKGPLDIHALAKLERNLLMLAILKNYHGQQSIDENDIYNLARDKYEARFLLAELRRGSGPLFENGFISKIDSKEDEFNLTPGKDFIALYKLETLFDSVRTKEIEPEETNVLVNDNFFFHQSINIKTEALYFNRALQANLDLYKNLLLNRDDVFEKNDFINGKLNLFFEGPPGCGKTAYAYQLAKQSNRDLYLVSWQTIRNRWIGETEKNLKSILDGIDEISTKSSRTPIILFNEAESFLSRRVYVNQSSDQGQNICVSMLLEWLEKSSPFSVVIFTANQKELLDKAFERRINPITFDHPAPATRLEIWKNKFKKYGLQVGDNHIQTLANLNISGAEIDNIFRSYQLHQLAYPTEKFDLEVFLSFSEQQKWMASNPIGFKPSQSKGEALQSET